MQFHFHVNQSHFQKKGFALRLALKQRTQKWPITFRAPNENHSTFGLVIVILTKVKVGKTIATP